MKAKDKKLLELAAKAAGIDIEFIKGEFFAPHSENYQCSWNPLVYSADAFELMVKLDVDLQKEKDPQTAARRKVVIAAAEMTKEKNESNYLRRL